MLIGGVPAVPRHSSVEVRIWTMYFFFSLCVAGYQSRTLLMLSGRVIMELPSQPLGFWTVSPCSKCIGKGGVRLLL